MNGELVEVPRVWVGCVACHELGNLVGEWVDAVGCEEFVPCDRDGYGHGDRWVFDTENLPIGECSPDEASRVAGEALACAEATGAPLGAVWAYWEDRHGYPDALDSFEESWAGEWDSAADYAADCVESTGDIEQVPGYLQGYIDCTALARDMELGGDITCHMAPGGGVWVFRSV